MADSDIQVGSRVRHVRNGAQGVVVHMTSTGGLEVDFGGSVRFCRSVGELELDEVKPIGSRVRYVGSHRDVRGSEGMVLEVTSDGLVVVDFGSTVRFCHPDDLIHVRPPKPSSEIRAADEVAANHLDHLDNVRQLQCRSAALPESGPTKSGPSIADLVGTDVTDESLNSRVFDVLASSLKVPFRTPPQANESKIFSRVLRAASSVDTVWTGSWTGIVTVGLEHGPGIAALNLQAPPRPRRRHQTTSWDPDMPLPDSEPGRYGWLP